MSNRTPTAIVLLVLAQALAGCSGSPSAPSPVPQPVPVPPLGSAPVVTAISPNTGSTGGDTPIKITGTGFRPGASVLLDGVPVRAGFDARAVDTIYLETPAHVAGTVDVVVTNPDGQVGRLTAGYVYVPPQSFDFNGAWVGQTWDGSDRGVRFTIQNNMLLSVSCDASTLAFSPPPAIADGAFSFLGNEGAGVSGKIVSASEASGSINIGPCSGNIWRAFKSSGAPSN